ncbi:MAG: hypothetical protein AMS26_09005, partial [Bacteroides sp. SM23_62]
MKNFLPILSAGLITLFTVLSYPACMNRSSGSQEDKAGQGKFTVDQLQADFRQFRQFLEESHPKLYQFTSRRTFDSLFEAHYQMIHHPMSTQEFYRILIPLVARVGCGHTSLWTPDGYWDKAPQRMFPLGVHALDGKLYVIHSYNQHCPVKKGSRIISVNGQNVETQVNEMLGNIWSDGFIMTKRCRRLNNVFPYLY